jgi:hypothetical protein
MADRFHIAIPLAAATWALTGCASRAYGPDSDTRLEMAVRDMQRSRTSEEAVAKKLAGYSCDVDRKRLAEAEQAQRADGDRLIKFIKLYADLASRQQEMDKLLNENPGAEYAPAGSEGRTARQALDECNTVLADARSAFDLFLRELVELPIVKEFRGGKELGVARVDFSLLRQGIELLQPPDRESLLSRIQTAEKRVSPGASRQRTVRQPARQGYTRPKARPQ